MSAMSVMRSSGLLGVSIHTSAAGFDSAAVDRGRIAEIDELHRELAALLPGREQAERAAVAVVRRDDARADRQQVTDQRDRAHAGAGDDGARAAFEIGERLGQQVARRIARAAVVVLALVAEAAKRVGGRKMQRRHHRAGHIAVSRPARTARVSWVSEVVIRAVPGLSFNTLAKIGARRRFSLRKAS